MTYEASGPVGAAEQVGEFELRGGELVVSDPCYALGEGGQATIKARPGRWVALVREADTVFGRRVAELLAVHSDYDGDLRHMSPLDDDIDVDSGQAGVYDAALYGKDEGVGPGDALWDGADPGDGRFYAANCAVTLGQRGAGAILSGCVASSGIGDGSYEVRVAWGLDGAAAAVRVVFLTEGGSPEDDDEEEDLPEDDEGLEDDGDTEGGP